MGFYSGIKTLHFRHGWMEDWDSDERRRRAGLHHQLPEPRPGDHLLLPGHRLQRVRHLRALHQRWDGQLVFLLVPFSLFIVCFSFLGDVYILLKHGFWGDTLCLNRKIIKSFSLCGIISRGNWNFCSKIALQFGKNYQSWDETSLRPHQYSRKHESFITDSNGRNFCMLNIFLILLV